MNDMHHQSVCPSPCTGFCVMDSSTGICKGCFRTMDEICGWAEKTTEERSGILQNIEKRKSRLGGK